MSKFIFLEYSKTQNVLPVQWGHKPPHPKVPISSIRRGAVISHLKGLRGSGHRIKCGGQDWVGGDGGPIIPIVQGPTPDEQSSSYFYGGIGRNLKCQIMKIH